MKAYAHPGNGDLSLCDINKAILSTMTVSRGAWKYVADIRADLQPELPLVPLALGRFNQAILNLIVNATHAIEDTLEKQEGGKGRITIATRRDGEFVFVEVSDTGCGMTDEVRRRLFEPFFTTKGVGKGTGQGLAILHAEIVDRLHGRIEVESALGVGSLFRLVIPLEAMPLPLHPDMPP
jgi:signal transduction histidine kinase